MRGHPAWHPDQNVNEGDCPVKWEIVIRRNGQPLNLTGLDLSCPVTDDGVEKGQLDIEITDIDVGEVTLTLESDLFALLRRYSTWQFRENTNLRVPLVKGRIVKVY